MFIDVTTIEPIMKISGEISDLISKIDKCNMDIESAETSMNIYAPDGYSSRFTRGEYARAKKEKEEAQSDLDKYAKKTFRRSCFLKRKCWKISQGGIYWLGSKS